MSIPRWTYARVTVMSLLGVLLVLLPSLVAPASSLAASAPDDGSQLNCVYSAHSIAELDQFSQLVESPVNCVTVFNNANPDWSTWINPWFSITGNSDLNWARWKMAAPGRRLIITQNLFPDSVAGSDWLTAGARGDFTQYAKSLAENLVARGLGDSYFRLAHEANGTWFADSVPSDTLGQAKWRQFWKLTVEAMRSVPGANFRFVWCVNYAVRNLPLASFYPGDGVVDVVGLDAYDQLYNGPADGRYSLMKSRSVGIAEVMRFSRQHHKQFALPEWGLVPSGGPSWGGGDDRDYAQGIHSLLRNNSEVAFQSYWYAHSDTMDLLADAKNSLPLIRRIYQDR